MDAALTLFEGLIGRAYNKAKKRVDEALRPSATTPDNRPCLLVRRTSRSPQRSLLGIARP